MAKDRQKGYKESAGLIRGFGDPKNAGIDSTPFQNLSDSAEAGFLKQQWDTKKPLAQNKKLDPGAQ
jgi:hypothetical protein